MTDPMLDLVDAALTAKLAADLGDRTSARAALSHLARLLPTAKLAAQQMPDQTDDSERPGALTDVLAAKYAQPDNAQPDNAQEMSTDE